MEITTDFTCSIFDRFSNEIKQWTEFCSVTATHIGKKINQFFCAKNEKKITTDFGSKLDEIFRKIYQCCTEYSTDTVTRTVTEYKPIFFVKRREGMTRIHIGKKANVNCMGYL